MMLSGIKVLDVTTGNGALCGHLLADLGAHVRHWLPPGLGERCDMRAYTINERTEPVDWRGSTSRLLDVLPCTDVLIHDCTDAQLRGMGLDPIQLEARFPGLIVVAITAFGADGPKSGYAATDLIALAASGHLAISGAADSAPVRIRVPQAFVHAAGDAAVGVLLALMERDRSGRGQRLDLSAQQSTTLATLSRSLDGAVGQPGAERSAYSTLIGAAAVRNQYELADGWALVLPGILPPLAGFMQRLVAWVHESGHCGDWVLEQEWGAAAMQLASGAFDAQRWGELESGIQQLLKPLRKTEVMQEAVSRRLLIAPILNVADVLAGDHGRARELVVEQQGRARLGAFAKFEATPLPLGPVGSVDWSAPVSPFAAADPHAASQDDALPLQGLKVLDMFWVVAGPGATRMLADYGATVIHVESRTRLDMVRNVPPYVDGIQEPERASCHHSTNANKLNLSLNLASEQARPVLDDLIRWADVITESFAPGVADRLGFGREHAQALNPDAIYISSCLMGQYGPWRDYAGYGNTAAAVTGFHALAGHPGAPPMGCFGPYTDFLSVRINALSILAAVRHHRQGGPAQYIDMSQAEAALQYLLPECQRVFDADMESEQNPALIGNSDPDMSPHGVYPTAGEDQWLAIAIVSDDHWRKLVELLQRPQWAGYDLEMRQHQQAQIDAAIAAFTSERESAALEAQLQELGIAAHRVLTTVDLFADEQLAHREHFIATDHEHITGTAVESTRLRMSRTSARVPVQAPSFGCDNRTVLGELLGYDAQRIESLAENGVLQ